MLLKECVAIGIKELLANKVRSLLSVLGIIIGVISLIVMMAIMSGMQHLWLSYINQLGGMERISVNTKVPVVNGESREDLKQDLSLADAKGVAEEDWVELVSAEIQFSQTVSYQGKKRYFEKIIAGNRDTLILHKQKVAQGRGISDEDMLKKNNVCVLGSTVSVRHFGPNSNPVGELLEIGGQSFQVIGLLKKQELISRKKNILESKNGLIFIPSSTAQAKLTQLPIQNIEFTVRDKKDLAQAKKRIALLLAKNHRVEGDVEIVTQEEKFAQSMKSLQNMKLGFSFIAGISLVVGGIGIMNIMIASITQRIREIGIRKAVGAKPADILTQFLMESVIISSFGGVIGIAGSFLTVGVMRFFSETPPVITAASVLLATSFSFLVGVFFGIYPAYKAAQLDPIKALRQ